MDVARPQRAPLQIAELVEHELRVIAGAAEGAVVGRALLIALVGLSLESMSSTIILGGRRLCTLSIQRLGRSARAARFSGRLSHSVSKRPIWLAETAEPWIARPPTTQRIAGSWLKRSASFTSS